MFKSIILKDWDKNIISYLEITDMLLVVEKLKVQKILKRVYEHLKRLVSFEQMTRYRTTITLQRETDGQIL